jgi:pyridoxal phosphate-dependent aminotransferase EpsN
MARIYLSPPHLSGLEAEYVREAFASNWVAPAGPHLSAFENELATLVGVPHAVAVSSGTAALHLALRLLGVGPGDEVLCATLTFSASANPICYEGGRPVFLDSEPRTWNMDPERLRDELRAGARRGRLPRAVVVVDLYGQCADYDPILEACARYEVPIIEDAAEALGATYKGKAAGSLGKLGVFSFNGNKIITTSGGGMLVGEDRALLDKARFLATQARDPAPHYEHSVVGFNYRLSNVLAGIGRGQLRVLPERIAARKRNFLYYRAALSGLPGLTFMPVARTGNSNYWLTCMLIDPRAFGATREQVRLALEADDIESRPTWKPLHLQPSFAGCRVQGGAVAEAIFERGLCLPSGSNLEEADLRRIVEIVRRCHQSPRRQVRSGM